MRRHASIPAIALAVFAISAVVLTLGRREMPLPLAHQAAVRAALKDPSLDEFLAGSHWDRATVTALDGASERVSFLAGGRVVAEAQVTARATVSRVINFRALSVPYGNWIAYEPGLVLGLGALFVLMTAVAPWRRLANLDLAATLSLLVPAFVLRARFVDVSVLAAVPGLVYLMLRCVSVGLGSRRHAAPSTPLWNVVTSGLPEVTRLRVLRVIAVGLGLSCVMVAVSSTSAVDVIYGVMEGATRLLHGVLPYGHMPGDVVHGDTYPILSYALYTPLAALKPVASVWDSVDLALGSGAICALAVAVALSGARWQAGERRSAPAREAALRAALAWLSFPLVLITVSTGTTDTVLAAIVAMAIVAWRRPAVATGLLTAAAWFKLAPAALVPVALAPLRRRRLARSLIAIAAVSSAPVALLLALGGRHGVAEMAHAVAYQFSRGSPQSLWSALGLGWLQPCGQAAVLALIAVATVKVGRDPELARDRRRIAALAAAMLIGLELAANYWAFLYVIWVVALVSVSVLGQGAAAADAAVGVREAVDLRGHPALA